MQRGTRISGYQSALGDALTRIAQWGATTLILSFGADTYADDPISHFHLQRQDFKTIATDIAALNMPTVIVMEGGYATAALGDNVAAFLSGFETT